MEEGRCVFGWITSHFHYTGYSRQIERGVPEELSRVDGEFLTLLPASDSYGFQEFVGWLLPKLL